jgi:hypothetical protein
LKEEQERSIAAVGISHLAREDGDALSVRGCVVERDGELALEQHEPRNTKEDPTPATVPDPAIA